MKPKERAEFYTVIASTAELFNRSLTDAAVELWWSALADLSLEAVKSGISRHLRDAERGKWMPTPADVRYFCGSRHPTALLAWSEVIDAMERHGAYRSVLFQDGVVNAVIRDLGGWPELCHRQANDDDPIWIQKEFERRYEEYRIVNRVSHQALLGLSDDHNINRGYLEYVQPEPIYIESAQEIPKLAEVHPGQRLIAAPTEKQGTNGGGLVPIGQILQFPKEDG